MRSRLILPLLLCVVAVGLAASLGWFFGTL